MNIQPPPLNRLHFEDSIFSLELAKKQLLEEKNRVEETLKRLDTYSKLLDGILKTHSYEDIPKHDSNESLYFFKNQEGKSVLIEELEPSPVFIPDMKRIPIREALTKEMKQKGFGYVVQRIMFSYPAGVHELILICFERNCFEKTEYF